MGGEVGRYVRLRPYLRDTGLDRLDHLDPEDYVPAPVPFGRGVDLREGEQLVLLDSWKGRFDSVFAALRADPDLNADGPADRSFVFNKWYTTPDAEVYAAMVADRKPTKIVEIGAGYSTRVARRTIDELGAETELVVIDPQPRVDVVNRADRVVQRPVEEVDLSTIGVDDRTLLFVDSSHIIRPGGDLPTIFCRLIPDLPPGVLVHVHDVYLPYDYPSAFYWRLYTEAYMLWALLARGSDCRVLFGTHFMVRTQLEAMRRVFGDGVATNGLNGTSFWFELT
jgi:hypothetical protein